VSEPAPRFGVVGAGILGLAVARRLIELVPGATVTVFEKEQRVAVHQTGRNSGVAHAGLYYAPGSLKATLCRRGLILLRELCRERGLPYQECGKLVVARSEREVGGLREIERRAIANEVPGLRWIAGDALREIEPNVAGVAALHSPRTAIVDFAAIARSLASDVTAGGGTLLLGHEVTGIAPVQREVRVAASGGAELAFDQLVICAGLHADRVARLAGDDPGPAIIPFRGEYLRLKPQRSHLVGGLIYPVPDPALPFLGVHFTRRVDGTVDVGPNAVLALAREGYRRTDLALGDLADTLRWPGFHRLVRRHWRSGIRELHGSLSHRAFLRQARQYIPALQPTDVEPAPAGVRAQAVDRDGSLVDDFRISHLGRVVAVRNAPSPAATSSLAIAEHVAAQVLER
jgi:L-2-hydroxyglutarate oxidase LhgO